MEKVPIILPLQPEEIEFLRPKDKPKMSDWAEANYILSSETSEIAGPWSNDYVPFLRPIMDWLSDSAVHQVTIVKCTQAGGSELANITIGYTCDADPAPTLIVMPREDDAKRRLATRIRPMFKANPRLLRHLPKGQLDGLNIGKETVLDNMILYIAWSNSPAALSDNPVAKVILDEVGKYPAATGLEADPISLAKKRQRTFRTRSKLLVISSPVHSGDLLDAEFTKGDRCEWHVPCPFCGGWHVMKWANVELDKATDGGLLAPEAYRIGGHARYCCPLCQRSWTEYERWEAVSAGKYVPDGCKIDDNGNVLNWPVTSHHSCRITALMLHPVFQTIDELAADWAVAQQAKKVGNLLPLQDFVNSQLGEPWVEITKSTDRPKLTSHIGSYQQGTVPTGVQMVTCGVDVQLDHIWVSVDGWGYLSEAWSIFEGRLETGDTSEIGNLEPLRRFLHTPWPAKDNPEVVFYAIRTAIDCGYRPDVVLDFCRKCTDLVVVPVRGDDSVRSRPFRAVKVAGGTMTRYDLNLIDYKTRIYRLLFEAQTPGPGYWHLHTDTGNEILQQLSSEEMRPMRSRRGRMQICWILKKESAANHIWDCKVYSAFAAELAGARSLQPAASEQAPKPALLQRRRGGGFLDDLPPLFS